MESAAANSKKRPVETAAEEHAHMYPVVRWRLDKEIVMESSSLKSRKRAVGSEELYDYMAKETTGAYDMSMMPKRFKFPVSLDGEDCRVTGVYVRTMMLLEPMQREIDVKAAASGRR